MSDSPNILLIIGDDVRWDTFSCRQHPIAQTPNLDRLAAEGALIDNYFATTSLCAPSRATILTGLYAHQHLVNDNSRATFGGKLSTFPRMLQKSGYRTAFIGKWHIGNSESKPGFDYWLSFPGQGDYVGGELIENDRRLKSEGHITDVLTDKAVAWLQQADSRPFCLILAHKAAHYPFKPAVRHQKLFVDKLIPEPISWKDTLESKPAWQRAAISDAWPRMNRQGVYVAEVPKSCPQVDWNAEGLQKGWLGYYRVVFGMDEGIGRVVDALTELKQLDRTALIFSGDNGLLRGEHRRTEKRCMYEESIRLPLIVRYPPRVPAGSRPQSLTANIDLAPTLLELAGLTAPPQMLGRSLLPLFQPQPPADWRQSLLYQYQWERGYTVPTTLGVRTEQWSYATYPEIREIDELYDMAADPFQMTNLATNPSHASTLATLQQELQNQLSAVGYTT